MCSRQFSRKYAPLRDRFWRENLSSGLDRAGGEGGDIARLGVKLFHQLLDLRAGLWMDIERQPLHFGKEFCVLHGGVKSIAQNLRPIRRQARRRGETGGLWRPSV